MSHILCSLDDIMKVIKKLEFEIALYQSKYSLDKNLKKWQALTGGSSHQFLVYPSPLLYQLKVYMLIPLNLA